MFRRIILFFLIACLCITTSGCVSRSEYAALEERISNIERELASYQGPSAQKNGESISNPSSIFPQTSSSETSTISQEEKTELPKGIFVLKEHKTAYGEKREENCVLYDSGEIYFPIPECAQNVQVSEKTLSFVIKNEWIDVSFEYDIDDTITSDVDAERKVNSITSEFSSSQNSPELFRIMSRWYLGGYDIHEVWCKEIGRNGASYVIEHSTYSSNDDVVFSLLFSEAFNCFGDVTIHERVTVNYYDFVDIYLPIDTTIGRNHASDERAEILSLVKSIPEADYYDDFTSSVWGILNCLGCCSGNSKVITQ